MRKVREYRYLENKQAGHFKFYEIIVTATEKGFETKGRWGRIGQRATEQVKYEGASESEAKEEAIKAMHLRFQHGYELKERVVA